MNFIEKKLQHNVQYCLAHKRKIPYTSIKSFLGMLFGAFVITFFIDGKPSYVMQGSTLTSMFILTPFVFFGLVLLQSSLQKTFYNGDVFLTRKGILMPDFKGKCESFTAYNNIDSLVLYYFPLTPLFSKGPYLITHIAVKAKSGDILGVHAANLNDHKLVTQYLTYTHQVEVNHRFSWWVLTFLLLIPIFLSLGFIV